MIWLSLIACGQLVSAPEALQGADNISATVDLAGIEELEGATRLEYYALHGLLDYHVKESDWSGGAIRLVDYEAMLASAEARVAVADVLTYLATVDPSALESREERLAYWLNTYNAWTLQGVLSQLAEDPDWIGVESSTWDGEETGVTFAMFNVTYVAVGDELFTLNAIEHGIIRGDPYALGELEGFEDVDYFGGDAEQIAQAKAWHEELWGGDPVDARIHMALNCASYGCPDIGDFAWRGATIDADLTAAAARFLQHPGKGAGPDGISSLFSWFRGDFEGSHGSAQGFIEAYREDTGDVNYDAFLDYSWQLNIYEG